MTTTSTLATGGHGWFRPEDCRLDDFREVVEQVTDQLEVVAPSPPPLPTTPVTRITPSPPPRGRGAAERALAGNPHLARYSLKVQDRGGRLILQGRVKTGAEKDLAGRVAREAAGGPVENALLVRP